MNKIPLVIYDNGVRKVLGSAEVLNEGSNLVVRATFDDAESARRFLPDLGEISGSFDCTEFSVLPMSTKHCLACRINQCGKGKDDKNCLCCRTDHI